MTIFCHTQHSVHVQSRALIPTPIWLIMSLTKENVMHTGIIIKPQVMMPDIFYSG